MLFRSTGLGKAELKAELIDVKRQGDYLILEMQTTEPVRWKMRGGLSRRDVRALMKGALRFSILPFFLNPQGWFRRPAHPGEF